MSVNSVNEVSFESIKRYIEKKVGHSVVEHVVRYEESNVVIITSEGVEPVDFNLSDDGVTIKDRDGNSVTHSVYCVLFSDDLNDSKTGVSVEGIKNGVLVIGGRTLDESEVSELVAIQEGCTSSKG